MKEYPTEPSSDLRQFASFMFQTYTALVAEGFTEAQALTIISDILRANAPGGK